MEKFVNLLTLFKSCQSTVLPQNRSGITDCALKSVVTAHQSAVTQFESAVENLPELSLVPARTQSDVYEVNRNNALIESAVILRLSVFVDVRR